MALRESVVVYQAGALGDLLVSTAALYQCLQLFPNHTITIMGSSLWKNILLPSRWPQICYLVQSEKQNSSILTYWKANLNKDIWEEITFPFKNKISFLKSFETAINFKMESLRFPFLTFLARVTNRVGASKNLYEQFFYTHFQHIPKNLILHEKDKYLQMIAALRKKSPQLNFWNEPGLPLLKEFDHSFFEKVTGCKEKQLILINPTASIREKAWQSKNYRSLALQLKQNNKYEIQIIGSPSETDWLKEVAQNDFKILQPQSIFNLVDIIHGARLLITNTSSLQFIAAGTKTATLTLMGTAKRERWGPLGSECDFVRVNISDDSNIDKKVLEAEIFAYNLISVEMVYTRVMSILN